MPSVPQGPGQPVPQPAPTSLTKIAGYAVAGGILLIVADIAPRVAIATTGLLVFAVVLSNPQQLTAISSFISSSTGA